MRTCEAQVWSTLTWARSGELFVEVGEISWVQSWSGKVKCKSWQAFLGLLSPTLVLLPCPPPPFVPKWHRARGRTVESHFSAKGCRPDIHFWWTTLMPFRLKLPKPQKKLHNTSAARRQKQHLLTRHAATFAHLYTTHEGCQADRLADKECEGHSRGWGETPRVKETVYCFSTC